MKERGENGRQQALSPEEVGSVEGLNILSIYLKEASRSPILTRQEEVALFRRFRQGKRAQEQIYRDGLGEEERVKLEHKIEEGIEVRKQLIQSNLLLVVSIAKGNLNKGVPFLDLIDEGNIGLMRAIERFDEKRGNRFSTYATWWIRQAIQREIANMQGTIRIPIQMQTEIRRLSRREYQLRQEDRGVSLFSLALERDNQKRAANPDAHPSLAKAVIATIVFSLEQPIKNQDGEQDSVLADFIPDEGDEPGEVARREIASEEVFRVLETLPPKQRAVLVLRFGLEDGNPRTLEKVGQRIGVTRERVRQIEQEALRKLRHPSKSRKLSGYL